MERLLGGEWGQALLLEYVFLEVVTVLAARYGLATAVVVGQTLLRAREVDFLPCSEIFVEAFETFREMGDRGLSFTDAAIVAVARREGAPPVATFDTDFKGVEGLSVIPEEPRMSAPPTDHDAGLDNP
ncbi:hypothetical protein BH18GEM1_BH18GEM1_10640 [soil metagenome]